MENTGKNKKNDGVTLGQPKRKLKSTIYEGYLRKREKREFEMKMGRKIKDIKNPALFVAEETLQLLREKPEDSKEERFAEGLIVAKMMRYLSLKHPELDCGPDRLSPAVAYYDNEFNSLYLGIAAYKQHEKLKTLIPLEHPIGNGKVFKAREVKSEGQYHLQGMIPNLGEEGTYRRFVINYYELKGEVVEAKKEIESIASLISQKDIRIKFGHSKSDLGYRLFDEFLETESPEERPAANSFEKILEKFNQETKKEARKSAENTWNRLAEQIPGAKKIA